MRKLGGGTRAGWSVGDRWTGALHRCRRGPGGDDVPPRRHASTGQHHGVPEPLGCRLSFVLPVPERVADLPGAVPNRVVADLPEPVPNRVVADLPGAVP